MFSCLPWQKHCFGDELFFWNAYNSIFFFFMLATRHKSWEMTRRKLLMRREYDYDISLWAKIQSFAFSNNNKNTYPVFRLSNSIQLSFKVQLHHIMALRVHWKKPNPDFFQNYYQDFVFPWTKVRELFGLLINPDRFVDPNDHYGSTQEDTNSTSLVNGMFFLSEKTE